MKLKEIMAQRLRQLIVAQFGDAKLIRHLNGHHELVGGTKVDRAAALEWSSLFAHEIVFTPTQRKEIGRYRPLKRWRNRQFQPAP